VKKYYRLRKEYGEVKACHSKRLQGVQRKTGKSKKAAAEWTSDKYGRKLAAFSWVTTGFSVTTS